MTENAPERETWSKDGGRVAVIDYDELGRALVGREAMHALLSAGGYHQQLTLPQEIEKNLLDFAAATGEEPGALGRLLEDGRRLASEREDLIAQGVDPAELLVPLAPAGVGVACSDCEGWGEVLDGHRVVACPTCYPDAYEDAVQEDEP